MVAARGTALSDDLELEELPADTALMTSFLLQFEPHNVMLLLCSAKHEDVRFLSAKSVYT